HQRRALMAKQPFQLAKIHLVAVVRRLAKGILLTALLQQTSRPKATTANIDECHRQSGRRSSRAPQCGFVICSMR
ncbi:hypothetical protein SEEE5621_11670, partial [Salmonella enterica subsp. enterica serovar Enteritidis str. 6.0562-1]